jgi:hypothetical protein
MSSVIGICLIKNFYFHQRGAKELDANINDFAFIGTASGFYVTSLSFGLNYILYGGILGMIYGVIYQMLLRFFVNRRKRKAESIGIYV